MPRERIIRSREFGYSARPALACIMGERRAWTVEMISSVSMRVAELALDRRQRDSFVQQLNGMRVAQLVGHEPPTDSGLQRDVVQLDPRRAG